MGADWVKFHVEITRGAKRGIPRALRFVLMEIALAARPLRGRVELGDGMSDEDAVVDLLGGDRSEVVAALARFTAGEDPTLVFESVRGRRYLVFPSWERWNGAETSTTSAERMRRLRERRTSHAAQPLAVTRDGDVTSRDAPRGEERRSEETRSSGGVDPVPDTTARATAPPKHPPRIPPPDEASNLEHEILEALRGSSGSALATVATQEFASSLAAFSAVSPNAGRLEPEDVVLGVEQAAELVAAERAGPDHVPRDGPSLRKYVTGIVRRIRRGEASAMAKRRLDPDADEAAREVVAAFAEVWSSAHEGRTYPLTDGDTACAAGLLVWAASPGTQRQGYDSPQAAILRAARDYVLDPEPWFRDAGHPLTRMAPWLRSYRLPPAKTARPKPPELKLVGCGPPPPDVLEQFARGPAASPAPRRIAPEPGVGS